MNEENEKALEIIFEEIMPMLSRTSKNMLKMTNTFETISTVAEAIIKNQERVIKQTIAIEKILLINSKIIVDFFEEHKDLYPRNSENFLENLKILQGL